MNAKRVAVTQRVDVWSDRNEVRDALDQRLMDWLSVSECLGFTVPNSLVEIGEQTDTDKLQAWTQAIEPHAIVLSGGNDIGAQPNRDATESWLLDYAKERRIPVLGICRGMQMMTVWAGGSLVDLDGHVAVTHSLRAETGTWPSVVNSYHNQGVRECPKGFEVVATAVDGSVEAMRHEELPWQGWMWHPERDTEFDTVCLTQWKHLLARETLA